MISSLTQRCHCALINRGPLLRCLQGADPTFTLARGGTIVLCNEKGTISPKAADPHGMACKCFERPCMLCQRLYGIVFKDEPESVHVSVTSYASNAKVSHVLDAQHTIGCRPSFPSLAGLHCGFPADIFLRRPPTFVSS